MIDPYSTITVRGWQVNEGDARRFFFTEKPKTYAAWRGDQLNKDLAVNCGVIGAAFFWNKKELQDYFDQNPQYVNTRPVPCPMSLGQGVNGSPMMEKMASMPSAAEDKMGRREMDQAKEKAGTGMGEREYHPTQYVDFHYDAGMYKAADAVVLFYDFAPETRPNPFPGLSYAPEMP
jgi:hypothetical protein